MEIVSKKWNVFDVLEIQGRIDGLTSAGLKRSIDEAAVDGRRNLILDFTHVSYMSSAGLRVIVQSYKALKQIGGELTLVSVPPAIKEVFNISGMVSFLQILDELKSLLTVMRPDGDSPEIFEMDLDGISFEWRKASAQHGKFFTFGSEDKLLNATYGPADSVVCKPAEISFGLGLAALGEDYSDYKSLFGEAVVIGHHFFSYPAVSRPVVDYSYFSQESQLSLNFLYGFGINGEFARILRFDVSHKPLSIEVLLDAAGKAAETGVFGVVILGMSGGIHGMHLKKSPILENRPSAGNILDAGNFPQWMNFSLESEEINKTVVACGVVVKTTGMQNSVWKKALPENGGMHLHAAVFENGLWSNNIMEFEDELLRIVKEFEPQKVLHLLPVSKLKSGYIAIINLEAD
jgi:anti-sigma B factor antagonist